MASNSSGIVKFLIEAEERRIGRPLNEHELNKIRNQTSYKILSWLESVLNLRMPSLRSSSDQPADVLVHKSNFILQTSFGLFSFAIVTFIYISFLSGLDGRLYLLPYALLIILILLSLLFVRNLFSVWSHLTMQFAIFALSFYPVIFIPSIKGWDAFAAAVPWPVRLAAYIIPAGILALLSHKLGEVILRVKCPIKGCRGWCKRQSFYPVTFLCASCGKKYITTIYITGRGR